MRHYHLITQVEKRLQSTLFVSWSAETYKYTANISLYDTLVTHNGNKVHYHIFYITQGG